MKTKEFNIAKEFTHKPGPRSKEMGKFSGEEFYENVIVKLYYDALKNNEKIKLVFDGMDGINTGFIDESLGKLARKTSVQEVLDKFIIEWKSSKFLEDTIKKIINASVKKSK